MTTLRAVPDAPTTPPVLRRRQAMSVHHQILGATSLLLMLGLAMVLSASSVLSFKQFGSSYTLAGRQAMFAVIGLLAMMLMSRLPVGAFRRLAWPGLLIAIAMLMAVLVIGDEVRGQRNWINIVGPFRLQPSEFAKLGLVVWMAHVLARKDHLLDRYRHLLVPVLPVGGLLAGLVLLGGDFGNAAILIAMVAVVLFAAGAPLRMFVGLGAVAGFAVWALTSAEQYRGRRFSGWLDPSSDPLGAGYQVLAGQSALGTGGWWGVGLGASREKWGSLPEAHTDFIFAVVGEELGLLGTLALLVLIGFLLVAAIRLARSTSDHFVRYASIGVVAWIGTQSILNIGAVLGVLPITGVPLPLVSYGGSSLLPTLAAAGMLLAFARREPDVRALLGRKRRD